MFFRGKPIDRRTHFDAEEARELILASDSGLDLDVSMSESSTSEEEEEIDDTLLNKLVRKGCGKYQRP